jgi:hypothetical protein
MTERLRYSPRPWTQADDDELRALATRGASTREIGHRLDRTIAAVGSRAKRLQIHLKKAKNKTAQMG